MPAGPHSNVLIPSLTGLTLMYGRSCGDCTCLIVHCTTKGKPSRTCRDLPLRRENRYTSLGSIYNTFPNPALRVEDDASSETSVTVIANEPNAETPVPRKLRSATEGGRFGDFTVIASDPECTCTPEPSMESTDHSDTLGSFRVISSDPFTMCLAESNGNSQAKLPSQYARYNPAYMLQDEGLERAGRVSGTALFVRV